MVTEKDVIAAVKLCMKHLRKKEYELNLTAKDSELALKCLTTYRRKNGRSWAGYRKIHINLECWQFGNKGWSEYKRFNKDRVIGAIDVTDDQDILLLLVAHEVSHFVQYTCKGSMPNFMKKKLHNDRGHGEGFQYIYRHLRRGLVNPMIESKKVGVAA